MLPMLSGRTLARTLLFAALLAAGAAPALAAGGAGGEDRLDAVHHTADGKYLDFAPFGIVELPRIFLVRRAGALALDGFASSSAAVASGRYTVAAEAHGSEEQAGEEGGEAGASHAPEGSAEERSADDDALTVAGGPEDLTAGIGSEPADASHAYDATLAPSDGTEVLVDFSMTRHLVFIFLSIGVLALLLIPMAGKYRRGVGRTSAPRGFSQNLLETFVVYVRDEIARPNLGKKADRYLPYLLTVFFFILSCNLLGLVPWGAMAMSNITVTAVLAIFTFIVTQLAGTKDYWLHILWPPGIPTFVKFILVPIEIIGLFTKPFALAVRLFANMVAGHLVILNLIGLIFIIGGTFGAAAGYGTAVPAIALTVFIYALELLVVFIQAYVFTVLSALFIGMAAAEHEHDHTPGVTAHDDAVSHATGQAVRDLPERTVGTTAAMA